MYQPYLPHKISKNTRVQVSQPNSVHVWYVLMWRTVFVLSLVSICVGYWNQDTFQHVTAIQPHTLTEPTQTPVAEPEPFGFTRDGFSYTLTPVATYSIAGLVLHRLNYDRWFSLSRVDNVITTDLCMVWGENISKGAYTNKSLQVTQDYRFCLYRYAGGTPIDGSAFSNNHLIASDDEVLTQIKNIRAGDQVMLTGMLVNISAERTGEAQGKYEPQNPAWTTSTTRSDTGAGACEVMYVESVRLLARGNALYSTLFFFGKIGLISIVLVSVLKTVGSMLYYTVRNKKDLGQIRP